MFLITVIDLIALGSIPHSTADSTTSFTDTPPMVPMTVIEWIALESKSHFRNAAKLEFVY